MTTDSLAQATATRIAATGPEHCIAQRDDGVYADPSVLGTTLIAAVDNIFRSGSYFVGVDYPVLMKALFGHGPDLPRGPDGAPLVRIAADIQPFDPARRALYRAAKIGRGYAEYYFEPVWLPDPDDADAECRRPQLFCRRRDGLQCFCVLCLSAVLGWPSAF